MPSDADAQPLLVETMRAAGHHDAATCRDLLTRARGHLRAGPHKSRLDIDAALDAVGFADWRAVHRLAWAATTGLTWAWPPDPAVCPPVPGPEPLPRETSVCGCGADLPPAAKFCPACGTAR